MSLMRTSSTWPALAPLTATGPVQMWPGSFCWTLLWIAASAGGTASGAAGIWLAMPETVEIVTVSPLSTVNSGFNAASKYPQCTVSGAASSRWFAIPFPHNSMRLPFLKDEERASRNQREADEVIPPDRLLQVGQRKDGEDQQGDHFLQGLQLRGRIDRIAVAVRRHGEAILHERDRPADQDHRPQRHPLELEMPIPGERHEQVGADQQNDRQQIGR